MRYAQNTTVPVDRSEAEIKKTVQRYGATSYASGYEEGWATVIFEVHQRRVRFRLCLPSPNEDQYVFDKRGKRRDTRAANADWEKDCRQKWRGLALVVKAKLEAVESGITAFDEEFLAHFVLPGGGTIGDWASENLQRALEGKKLPPLLGAGS